MRIVMSAILLVFGCGGDDGGGNDGSPLDIADLGAEVAEVTCGKIFECCSEDELMDMFGNIDPPITTVEECETFYLGFFVGLFLQPAQDAVERGSLIYDAARAGTCMADFAALSCSELNLDDPEAVGACDDVFMGQLADDASCLTDLECASQFCDGETIDGDPGVCRTKPILGEVCEVFDCDDGLYCDGPGIDGICAETKADGADCTSDRECQSDNCETTCMPAAPECTG